MTKNQEQIDSFLRASKRRAYVAQALEKSGFETTYVAELSDYQASSSSTSLPVLKKNNHNRYEQAYADYSSSSPSPLWCFWAKPSKTTELRLGTAREVLVIGAEYWDLQVKTITAAKHIIAANDRLSDELCLIFSMDSRVTTKIQELSQRHTTHYIGLHFDDLKRFPPNGPNDLMAEIQSHYFVKDLYNISSAITAKEAFYGRSSLLSDIGQSLRSGQAHIGLFGLRKMGKTSVLLRLLEILTNASGIYAAHLDIQRLDSVRQEAGFLLWSLGEQLLDSNRRLRHIEGLKLLGKHTLYSEIGRSESDLFELFSYDLTCILSTLKAEEKIVLLMDEIEHLLPSSPGSQWENTFVRVWRLLRGISQTFHGKIAYFISGTSPSCVETPKINGIENPAYNFFKKVFLGPLTDTESTNLLTDIGRRIGLNWQSTALSEVQTLVGGHPFLLRAYGSRVHQTLSPRTTPREVSREQVTGSLKDVQLDVNSVLTQMIEVLQEEYKDEYYLLDTLAQGNIGEFREYAETFTTEIAHIRGYGLIDDPAQATELKNRLLHDWMRARRKKRRDANTSSDQKLAAGDRVEGYEIIGRLGHPGGFGDVFIAKSERPPTTKVALKIIRSGSISALNREVEALQSLETPGVVKVLEHGKTPSGSVFLVMEYLDGPSLRSHCSVSTRLNTEGATEILQSILKTLVTIHPDTRTISKLRSKSTLSSSDLQRFQRARFGVIHRDIKPDNIILTAERGPVLIDFGIASKVGDQVRTVSATPGYLPPDGVGNAWTPDVDLYSLAVSIAQALTGILVRDASNTSDICVALEAHARGHIRDVLLKEIRNMRDQRFASATDMLNALSGGVT